MKFGMIDQENATSLQTIEKGKNELMRLDKFLTEMGLGTRSEVKKILKTKQITVNGEIVTKPEIKRLHRKTTRYLIKVNRSLTVNTNIIFFINRQGV